MDQPTDEWPTLSNEQQQFLYKRSNVGGREQSKWKKKEIMLKSVPITSQFSYSDILSGKASTPITKPMAVKSEIVESEIIESDMVNEARGLPIPTLINKTGTGPVRKNNKPTKNVNLSDFIFSEKDTKQKQESKASKNPISKQKNSKTVEKELKTVSKVGNVLDASAPILHKGKTRERSKKKPTTLKKIINKDREERKETPNDSAICSDRVSTALNGDLPRNEITPQLNDAVLSLLSEVKRFQDRLWTADPNKARLKRRMVVGLHEVHKHLVLHNIKFIIMAPNVECGSSEGGLDDQTAKIRRLCMEQNVPCVFALSKNKLGKTVKKFSAACVAVLNYQGAETLYKTMMKELEEIEQNQTDQKEIKELGVSRDSGISQISVPSPFVPSCSTTPLTPDSGFFWQPPPTQSPYYITNEYNDMSYNNYGLWYPPPYTSRQHIATSYDVNNWTKR